jgi:hypothetical protein
MAKSSIPDITRDTEFIFWSIDDPAEPTHNNPMKEASSDSRIKRNSRIKRSRKSSSISQVVYQSEGRLTIY